MKATTLRDYKTRLLRVLVHIQQHLAEPLLLDELAARACLSPFHFHRVFTGMLGESLQCHIRRLRLERAAWQLKLGRAPVVQIALGAGYETHEAFSRAFRSAFRLSPTQYRRRHAASPTLPARSHVHYLRGAPLRNSPNHPPHESIQPCHDPATRPATRGVHAPRRPLRRRRFNLGKTHHAAR